jgi:D-lactate dehydrogenase (cytochrome)
VNTVIETIQLGIPVARIELLDEVQLGACIAYSKMEEYDRKPTLFFEFHGTEAGVEEQTAMVEGISRENGGGDFRWATRQEDRSALWQARHDAYFAALALRPGKRGISSDVCVPISRLAECIVESRADIDESGLVAPIVGHVGDGNFHVLFVIDPDDADEVDRLAMGGTCTGEHGIGVGKMDFLVAEQGEAVSIMRAVKMAVDPDNIMNPGKILRV